MTERISLRLRLFPAAGKAQVTTVDLLPLEVDVKHWTTLGCHFCEEWLKYQNPGGIYAVSADQRKYRWYNS